MPLHGIAPGADVFVWKGDKLRTFAIPRGTPLEDALGQMLEAGVEPESVRAFASSGAVSKSRKHDDALSELRKGIAAQGRRLNRDQVSTLAAIVLDDVEAQTVVQMARHAVRHPESGKFTPAPSPVPSANVSNDDSVDDPDKIPSFLQPAPDSEVSDTDPLNLWNRWDNAYFRPSHKPEITGGKFFRS